MGTLYVIATPIGNLEDITLRGIRLLKEVDLIAAEDTRKARILLKKYDISNRLTSYHEQNKVNKLPHMIRFLKEKGNIGLISEAGTPGINDPGYELINAAILEEIPIVPVPGPSAPITALSVSGLPTDQFIYIGYLPRRTNERRKLLQSFCSEHRTIVCLETPHRLHAALADIAATLGNRKTAVHRELTKLHEEIFRGTVQQSLEHFTQPKGEFTIVLEGSTGSDTVEDTLRAEELLKKMRSRGYSAKDAVTKVSEATGLSRKELYGMWLRQLKTK
ncbi:MAG: 16S rRNA (cytidine(1402)-2'-O)-methyltransferase [Dehalococcoidia bacterium]|nr:16S rRNA (cytidine(1402)-2'-O)-methyltransferase [Dehalococcoidia bacterium]